jgi:iron-sulfur cluster repair protein YtfE (RIC family)
MKSVQGEGMADVRDMYLAHTLFRREFARLPDLIVSIPDGDIAGAETVGSHVAMLCRLLHLHHEGEDQLVWPKLAARGGAEADAIVPTMEKQHHTIEVALARVDELLPAWRSSGRGGGTVADTLHQLLPALLEHMALEEAEILPLAEKHITAPEWKELVGHSMRAFPKKYLPLVFGLMMEQGDPAVIQDVLDATPLPVRLLMPIIAPRIAIAHNKRLRRAGSQA